MFPGEVGFMKKKSMICDASDSWLGSEIWTKTQLKPAPAPTLVGNLVSLAIL